MTILTILLILLSLIPFPIYFLLTASVFPLFLLVLVMSAVSAFATQQEKQWPVFVKVFRGAIIAFPLCLILGLYLNGLFTGHTYIRPEDPTKGLAYITHLIVLIGTCLLGYFFGSVLARTTSDESKIPIRAFWGGVFVVAIYGALIFFFPTFQVSVGF